MTEPTQQTFAWQRPGGAWGWRDADTALLLNALAGSDPTDPTTADADAHKVDFTAGLADASLAGVRIGVMRKAVGSNPDVAALFERALADLKRAGAELVDIDFAGRIKAYAVVDLRVLGSYDWRLSAKNAWKVEQLLLDWPHRAIASSDARAEQMRARYRAFREAHGYKPWRYYSGRDRWSPLPPEFAKRG